MDFKPEDMKTVQLEVTVDGRKLKSQIPKFTGDGVESLLYTKQRFGDAMITQDIDPDKWQEEFGRTLHGDPGVIWDEVLVVGDELNQPFDLDAAGFDLAFEFYIKRYVADPNGRDTLAHALDTRAFRFGLSEVGGLRVERHIRRIKTCVRHLPDLPGTIVFGPTQLRHTVMGTFQKKRHESYMMDCAERYHRATIAFIQQHMSFVYALEEKSKPAEKSDKNKKLEKDRRQQGGRFYRGCRGGDQRHNNNTQPYNNNNYENHYQDGGQGGGGLFNNRGGRGGGGRGGRGGGGRGRGYQGNHYNPNYNNRYNNQNPYNQNQNKIRIITNNRSRCNNKCNRIKIISNNRNNSSSGNSRSNNSNRSNKIKIIISMVILPEIGSIKTKTTNKTIVSVSVDLVVEIRVCV